MQVVVRIIIILFAILLIWLLRKWIKRLIFIFILLALAFFIYGIFNPSGASRLWYNVRTFPQRVYSWISNKSFIDYDSYRLDISSVGTIGEEGDGNNLDIDSVRKVTSFSNDENKDEILSKKGNKGDGENVVVQSFTNLSPTVLGLSGLESLDGNKNEVVTGYSKVDVLGIIGKYIENNLDDDTDILVTIEYENDYNDPDKIILQTQGKSSGKFHFVSIPRLSIKKALSGLRNSKSETVKVTTGEIGKLESDIERSGDKPISVKEKEEMKPINNKTYNGLTQSEVREAEEIFSILF